jgi:hypothetical protein
VKQKPEIGWVEVERSSVYVGHDVYILANPGWDVVITVPTHNRPPLPNSDDYRCLDPKTYDGEFFQEEGLPGRFTINLPSDEDMDLDGEEDKVAGMHGGRNCAG